MFSRDGLGGGEEGTSNNKVKERDIHIFLRKVLGGAPYPEWGLPEGSQAETFFVVSTA